MDGTDMLTLTAVVTSPFALASVTFLVFERRFRVMWAGLPLAPVAVGSTAYRATKVIPGHTQRAPSMIRWAAFSSFFLGQMFLPGLALGLIGLAIMGVGLVSIPGLIVAARLWAAGIHLLKGTPESIGKARSAARWSVQLNVLISIVCTSGGIFTLIAYLRSDSGGDDVAPLLGLLMFTQTYALISLGQAALIAHATRDLVSDDELAREDVLPRWIRAALNRRDARRAEA
jgi:hypothetical protein